MSRICRINLVIKIIVIGNDYFLNRLKNPAYPVHPVKKLFAFFDVDNSFHTRIVFQNKINFIADF